MDLKVFFGHPQGNIEVMILLLNYWNISSLVRRHGDQTHPPHPPRVCKSNIAQKTRYPYSFDAMECDFENYRCTTTHKELCQVFW